MEPDGTAGGEQRVKALCQQRAENTAEHIAGTSLRQGGITGGIHGYFVPAADQGPVPLQDQDCLRIPGRKLKCPGKAPG